MSLLDIRGLRVSIGGAPVLTGVDLSVEAGETVGLVGESGSGKSMTALAVMGLLPPGAAATGTVALDGTDVLASDEAALCSIRGRRVGMVFQEPMTALNPVRTIGDQVAEGIAWHTGASRAEAEAQARRMLDRVGLPPARFPLDRYPHQLSGGQRQRVVIAIACALGPQLLIADEPTTALDVVLQRQVLDLLRDLVRETRMGLLLISHDLAIVTEMADRIAIMRAGTIVDGGGTAETLSAQRHPYTRQLALASTHMPDRTPAHRPPIREGGSPLLDVRGVSRVFRTGSGGWLRKPTQTVAVDDVSFALRHGRSTALVGRSGCGKSTLARLILALDKPTTGTISFEGKPVTGASPSALRAVRRELQVVFQDPFGSLDPRLTIEKSVAEPLGLLPERLSRSQRRERVAAALHEVGLSPDMMDRHPHQFSGGQRQRISIARAIITRPRLVVADEAVSSLDVSIRAQILDLLADLNRKLGLTYLFITHDLSVARAITDDVLVMQDGRIVERGETAAVLDNPRSDAAKALVAAAPDLRRALAARMREQG